MISSADYSDEAGVCRGELQSLPREFRLLINSLYKEKTKKHMIVGDVGSGWLRASGKDTCATLDSMDYSRS